MSRYPTPDEYLQIISAYQEAGGNAAVAAKAISMPVSTFKDRLQKAARKGYCGTEGVLPGFGLKTISTKSDGAWVTQAPLGDKFELPEGHAIQGVSALVDAGGNTIQQWIKTKADANAAMEALRIAVDELKQELPRIAPTKGPEQTAELLLNQYTITDLHFGMLCWGEETRGDNYDLQIAEKLLLDWFSAAIAMAPNARVGVLAQLGDLMHHDSHDSVTPTNRNLLDSDSRLQKIIRVVIRVLRQVIAMLLERHEQVHIIMASANHDPASSAWLREMLHAMYDNEPRLSVENSPDLYYAYEWGKTALFYHHGHKRKIANVDSVFAGKFREMYGRAEYSYGHIGHMHSDQVAESNLMKVERHRTLAPADAYASAGGWLSKRDAKVITYHQTYGEVSRITLSPQMVQAA